MSSILNRKNYVMQLKKKEADPNFLSKSTNDFLSKEFSSYKTINAQRYVEQTVYLY